MTGVSLQTSAAICAACFLQTALQTILVRYASKHLAFSHSFTTWMIEITKLCLASSLWLIQGRGAIHWRLGWGIPAVCYAINNRLFFYTLQFVDGGTFQILSNLKIMTTLLWSVALLRKSFSPAQWGACVLLTTGAMLVHGDQMGSINGVVPMLLIGVQVTCSGFASVMTEKLLKEPIEGETFAQQCMQLYIMGLPLMSVYVIMDPPVLSEVYISPLWLCILINGSLQGLVIGSIMKFLGSIPRLIATVSSVGITLLYTHYSEHTVLSHMFVAGNVVILAAVVLYNKHTLCPDKQTVSTTLPK